MRVGLGVLSIEEFRIAGFSISWFGGFGGSVPVVVLVLTQQLQGLGGLGEDADGFGAAHVDGVVIALFGEEVGDPVDGGFEPDGISGSRSGNDQFQPVCGAAAQPDEPLLRGVSRLLFGTVGVGVVNGGLKQGLQPAPRDSAK